MAANCRLAGAMSLRRTSWRILYINALGTRPNPVEAAQVVCSLPSGRSLDPVLEDFYLGINDEQQKQPLRLPTVSAEAGQSPEPDPCPCLDLG